MAEVQGRKIGKVTHYFSKIGVAVIKLKERLKVGDEIHIKGATSDFKQKVDSMQIEHDSIEEAEAGQSVGLKVKGHAREHDDVYKV
jgi:putative protease